MNLIRWKALYFFHVLSLLIFTCYCTSCREKSSDKTSTSAVISKKTTPLDTVHALAQADSLYALGEHYLQAGKYDSALILNKRALSAREEFFHLDSSLVKNYFIVGKLYYMDNKFDVADKYFEKARGVAEKIETPFALMLSVYQYLFNTKKEIKDFPTALSLTQKMLHLVKEKDPGNKIQESNVYRRLAIVYNEQKQFDKAIENYNKAIQLSSVDDHNRLSNLFFGASVSYNNFNKQETALRYIDRAILEDARTIAPNSLDMSGRILFKAFLLLDLNKVDSGRYYLNKALKIRREIYGNKSSFIWGVKWTLGDFYFKRQQYDSSAWHHQQGIISLVKEFNNDDIFANPAPSISELNPDLVMALVDKAKSVAKMFERDSSRTEFLDLALNTYLLADSVFAAYRKNILHDDPVMKQMEVKLIPYAEIVNICMTLFNKKKSLPYLEKAFNLVERSRAVVIQNALNRASSFGSMGVSDSVLKVENRLIRIRAELLQQLNNTSLSQSEVDSLNEELLKNNNEEVDYKEKLKNASPNYFTARNEIVPSLDKTKELLAERNSVFVEYMWSDQTIFAIVLSKDDVKIKSLPVTDTFIRAFNDYLNEFHKDPGGTIDSERFKRFCYNSFFLYNFLIKDLVDGISENAHIIISADGPLATIPFDAFLTEVHDTAEVNYHLPYLLLQHSISYAYSASVLLKQSTHKREGKKLLAFGYAGSGSSRTNRGGLSNLPGTKKEVLAIKEVMKNDVNKYELEEEATEVFFKQRAPDFDIIHLAVHGEGDTLNSLNSKLIFRNEKDSVEDGSLYAHELYDLNLNKLDLVVLSACESGIGKQQVGEGVMSIARGFAYAGCPSMVISLWKLDDRTAAKVMKGFYSHLSSGEQLDDALAGAKSDYIKEAGEFTSHPFYWAAFLQVGDVRQLDIKKPNWWGWALIVGILLTGLMILMSNKARPKMS